MIKVKKILNAAIYLILFLGVIALLYKYTSSNTERGALGLCYVYSNSMEPTIMTNDGFILIKSKMFLEGDIITYKPVTLSSPYVTHRIVQVTSAGEFVTKGDNSPLSDQQGGEPLVVKEQVIGKVLFIAGKPFIIPYMGLIVRKLQAMAYSLNIYILLSIAAFLLLAGYVMDNFLGRKKKSARKHIRLKDIAPYFDPLLWVFTLIFIVTIYLLGQAVRSWFPVKVAYNVVGIDGLPSPMAGETFTKTQNIKNSTFLPYIAVLEPDNSKVGVNPTRMVIQPYKEKSYTFSIKAPDEIGRYTENVHIRAYPYILPNRAFEWLYSVNRALPLMVIFIPLIAISIGLYIWWIKRWSSGRREVMPWLIKLRPFLRNIL